MSRSDEDLARRSADAMWASDAASKALGMEIVSVGPGSATLRMVVREDMINGWDLSHGGLVASLADSAFAFACNSRGTKTVASGFDITLLAPAHLGDELLAVAVERSLRGRSGLYDVTVTRASDDTVIAEFRGRSRAIGGQPTG